MTYPWNGAAIRAVPNDYLRAADEIQAEVATIMAVWQVESNGNPFGPDSALVHRFELHKTTPPITGYKDGLKVKAAERERQFVAYYAKNPEDAMRATSWGACQILGSNHQAAGYDSAAQMVVSFAYSEGNQIAAFIRLIKAWGLDSALRAHDWRTFARRYNGNANVEAYAAKLEKAYRALAGQASPAVLRSGDKGAAVKALQASLGVTVDGSFGPETLAAVRDKQASEGLAVDGVVGAKTWATLSGRAPAQDTPSDLVAKVTAQAGAGAAAIGTASAALRELPETATIILVAAAALGGLLALGHGSGGGGWSHDCPYQISPRHRRGGRPRRVALVLARAGERVRRRKIHHATEGRCQCARD
ncbi:MAG TPA: N-acetylmuramidase domain-containing protein [Paenirhodobacter sp.]